jgi:DUF4097 and DUF4098 domain-containing protein YvlB
MEPKMRKICLSTIFFLAFLLAGTFSLRSDNLRVEKKEEIRKTLTFQNPSQPGDLQVDNIWGSIAVKGTHSDRVELIAHKTIKARTESRIQKAKEEVTLDITEENNVIDIYVDGPFRQRNRRGEREYDPGYEVHYDFEIEVPYRTNIFLKTVTDGDIEVTGIQGEFEVRNVNGKISMEDISGSGTAHTVNGKVKVSFASNPESDCSFKTINGDIDAAFTKNLSADFRLKSRFGDAYSDFQVSYLLASSSPTTERKNGKFIYRSNRFIDVRVGSGGPEIKMDTLNGDILINKR